MSEKSEKSENPRQGAAFRRRLLERLPKLEVRGFAMADTVRGAAASVDLKSILDLEADAFITPLEPLAPPTGSHG